VEERRGGRSRICGTVVGAGRVGFCRGFFPVLFFLFFVKGFGWVSSSPVMGLH